MFIIINTQLRFFPLKGFEVLLQWKIILMNLFANWKGVTYMTDHDDLMSSKLISKIRLIIRKDQLI